MNSTLKILLSAFFMAISISIAAHAAGEGGKLPPPVEWRIDGIPRQAIVLPAAGPASLPAPVLFVFHGHGGSMQKSAMKGFRELWPEAVTVCPQGLATRTGRDPDGRRAGWQQKVGDHDNRDVKFFDAMLTTLRENYHIDDSRVFATGHSNGGGFTYLLWGVRGSRLAAIAPFSAGAGGLRNAKPLKPLPVFHGAGQKDSIVPFENQMRTMKAVRAFNQCDPNGRPWAKAGTLVCTFYPSGQGAPFVSAVHQGAHAYPDEASALIVRFFKELPGAGSVQK